MNKKVSLAALVLCLASFSSLAKAVEWTVGIGHSGHSSMVYRLGLQWDWQSRWWQSEIGHLTGYWDAGYSYWDANKGSSASALSFAPVVVYEFSGKQVRPFIEAGIGLAAFSRTRVEDNKLSTSFQFEDRLGIGLRFADHELGLRMLHYSNARLKRPNDGIESYSLYYRASF